MIYYPKIFIFNKKYRDVTISIKKDTTYIKVYESLQSILEKEEILYRIEPLSIYSPNNNLKKISFRITFSGDTPKEQIKKIMQSIDKTI